MKLSVVVYMVSYRTKSNIRKLELDYAKIQATTKIGTYDELMKVFIDIEEKNFKAFQFINELCNQIEIFESQINSLKSKQKFP